MRSCWPTAVASSRTRQDILPRLEGGLLAAQDTTGRGTLFPQPRLVNGVLMDQQLGHGWRLVLDASMRAVAALPGLAVLALGEAETAESEGVVAGWMHRHGCRAALVRPDHCVYGTATDAQTLDALLAHWHAALH